MAIGRGLLPKPTRRSQKPASPCFSQGTEGSWLSGFYGAGSERDQPNCGPTTFPWLVNDHRGSCFPSWCGSTGSPETQRMYVAHSLLKAHVWGLSSPHLGVWCVCVGHICQHICERQRMPALSTTLQLIPLRHSLSLTLELGRQSASSNNLFPHLIMLGLQVCAVMWVLGI